MAERMMLVCDTCGRPAAETVTFKSSAGNRQRDYCSTHRAELLAGSRVPKRGRKPESANGVRKTTPKKATARKKSATRKPTKRTPRKRT